MDNGPGALKIHVNHYYRLPFNLFCPIASILLDFSLIVKAASHECVIRSV